MRREAISKRAHECSAWKRQSPRQQEAHAAILPAGTHERKEDGSAFCSVAQEGMLKVSACIFFMWIKMKIKTGSRP